MELRQVAAPRQKLEDLFLQIVKDAQQSRLATGGVTAGGGVAEFLRGQADEARDGREVIDDLLDAGAAETEPPDAQAEGAAPWQAPPSGPADDVIGKLVTGAAETAQDDESAEDDRQLQQRLATARRQADRGVIDDLLSKNPASDSADGEPDDPAEAPNQ